MRSTIRLPAFFLALIILNGALFTVGLGAPRKTSSTQPAADWKKLTSSSGIAKSTPKYVKFQPTTARFRIHLTGNPAAEAGPSASAAVLRIALMSSATLDNEGKPGGWQQVEMLTQGQPNSVSLTKEFDSNKDGNGNTKWFALQITGQASHFEVIVEQGDNAVKPDADTVKQKPSTKPGGKSKNG